MRLLKHAIYCTLTAYAYISEVSTTALEPTADSSGRKELSGGVKKEARRGQGDLGGQGWAERGLASFG